MARALLITGATDNQGGAVVDALFSKDSSDFLILAAIRDAESTRAEQLTAKSASIKFIKGDLNSVPGLLASAKKVAGNMSLRGVYSVQVSVGKGVTLEGERVERGGDEKSWDNLTPVPHFKTKHEIEHCLCDSTAKHPMGWKILRPVIFMENLHPGFAGKVFLTSLRDTMRDKPLQWVATKDIGYFTAGEPVGTTFRCSARH
ncbi:hypothetical protein B0J13DRAFT_622823 [Dactylonectria estremocensis]|uniref:NmrA-like domain-containing protein n=1 Tax=Dactylonectria estremocensis TaxID=1079267 RepID=A0A9P9EUR8_9HYPO|nr:hypothetical protein B0J13DRAFT_622823 [Dactylonectria estremocensis]